MRSLYMDTTGKGFTIATENAVAKSAEHNQSDKIFAAIEEVLSGAQIKNLDRIIVMRGPGSFTGIRLGLSIAKGFAIAAAAKVIALDNFKGIFLSTGHTGRIAIPEGRDFFNADLDADGNIVGEPWLGTESGFTAPLDPQKILKADLKPAVPEPLYIRPHYAKIPCKPASNMIK